MIIHDYTGIFRIEKKFRGIRDIRLPEVSYRTAGWGVATAAVASLVYWVSLRPLLALLPLPGIIQVALPVAVITALAVYVARAATNRLKHDKELLDLVLSWVAYRTRPRQHVDLRPWNPRTRVITNEYVQYRE